MCVRWSDYHMLTCKHPKHPWSNALLKNNDEICNHKHMCKKEKIHPFRLLSANSMSSNKWYDKLQCCKKKMQNIPCDCSWCTMLVSFLTHDNNPKNWKHNMEKPIQLQYQEEDLTMSESRYHHQDAIHKPYTLCWSLIFSSSHPSSLPWSLRSAPKRL